MKHPPPLLWVSLNRHEYDWNSWTRRKLTDSPEFSLSLTRTTRPRRRRAQPAAAPGGEGGRRRGGRRQQRGL